MIFTERYAILPVENLEGDPNDRQIHSDRRGTRVWQ